MIEEGPRRTAVVVKHPRWTAMVEKKGLLQEADVLEKYGIGSATEMSELEQDDISDLLKSG
jgi:hypothetical protein